MIVTYLENNYIVTSCHNLKFFMILKVFLVLNYKFILMAEILKFDKKLSLF